MMEEIFQFQPFVLLKKLACHLDKHKIFSTYVTCLLIIVSTFFERQFFFVLSC
jgi:hypothetical protein